MIIQYIFDKIHSDVVITMLEIQGDIVEIFFEKIKNKGKYEIDIKNNTAYIIPRSEERYYKPIIKIPDLDYFRILLMEYISSVKEFLEKNNMNLKPYQDLGYVFRIMLFNLAPSDAADLNRFIETRISLFRDDHFEELKTPVKIFEHDGISFYAKRELEEFGLETPYIMTFSMEQNGKKYDLPMIRYGIDDTGVCYIYAVQIGRGRSCDTQDPEYKKTVNSVNRGVKEHRDVSPSFVLVLAMFLKILCKNNICKIVIPDFLFNRYKKYYRATTTKRSDEILSRMFHNIMTLVMRMDSQIDGFSIQSYPLELDSYYHIELSSLRSKNIMLKALLQDNHIKPSDQ